VPRRPGIECKILKHMYCDIFNNPKYRKIGIPQQSTSEEKIFQTFEVSMLSWLGLCKVACARKAANAFLTLWHTLSSRCCGTRAQVAGGIQTSRRRGTRAHVARGVQRCCSGLACAHRLQQLHWLGFVLIDGVENRHSPAACPCIVAHHDGSDDTASYAQVQRQA